MRRRYIRSIVAACALLIAATPLLAQTPPGAAGTVTLPLSEYDRLVERAAKPVVPPAPPPVASVVARADLQVRASVSDVRGTITLTGEVLADGRFKVPLVSGATLSEVQQAGAPVPVMNDAGVTAAILTGPGPFTIVASFVCDVTTEPGRAGAMLPAVRAGTVRATIEAPGENVDIRVEPGLAGTRSSAGGKTTVDVTLQPGTASRISWSSREQAVRGPREVRMVSDVKTLMTVGESDLRLASLFDVNVLQGQPSQLDVRVPDGFDVVAVSGPSIETTVQQPGRLSVAPREATQRRLQFLVTFERTVTGGVQKAEVPLPALNDVQRETGEVAWEGVGTIELTAAEKGPLHRLDVSEVSASLAALAQTPLLSAFRYQRRGSEVVPVAFEVRRFADASVIGAAAESAVVTTLVNAEGRCLTQFDLTVQNRGQLFLKVGLPKGATLVSAEVGDQVVKPVEASDGIRVPLVRPGYRPRDAYKVSFVYVDQGTAFAKKGEAQTVLPRVDVPINVLEWELFLPERYEVKRFEGDVMPAGLMPAGGLHAPGEGALGTVRAAPVSADSRFTRLSADTMAGRVLDTQGGVLPGVTVRINSGAGTREAVTDSHGVFFVSGVGSGAATITAQLVGFHTLTVNVPAGPRWPVELVMNVAGVAETVSVTAEAPVVRGGKAVVPPEQAQVPSSNVVNLQQRVSGVLPVRMDVPRAGKSYRFVRTLVVEEETTLKFQYKVQ